MLRVSSKLLLCVVAFSLLVFGQDNSTTSEVRLSVLVANALAHATPSRSDLAERIWHGGINEKVSRSDFEARYGSVEDEYRRDARIQLQGASHLFAQLNVIETIALCATDANHQLLSIASEASNPNLSWQSVQVSWGVLSGSLPCMSEKPVQKGASITAGRASLVQDGKVKDTLNTVVARVERATAQVNKAIKLKDQAALQYSTRVLANQLDLFCVVTGVELTMLSKDIHDMVPSMGIDEESPKALNSLERLLASTPEN